MKNIWSVVVLALLAGSPGDVRPPAQKATDNVVVVLDASGSMGETLGKTSTVKMDAAKQALREVLKQVPAATHVGILVFSAANATNEWIYPLGPKDEAALDKAIGAPLPGDGTPLAQYIKKGADRLLQEREKNFGYGTYRLLVVTDGEETVNKAFLPIYTRDVISRGLIVDVIGVGMESKHTLATTVHSYRSANDPQALRRAVAAVFSEVALKPNGQPADNTFDLIKDLPDGTAEAMITSLARSGNYPIGEAAPAPVAGAGGVASPTPGSPAGSPVPAGGGSSGRHSGPSFVVVVFVLLFIFAAVRALLRRQQGRAR